MIPRCQRSGRLLGFSEPLGRVPIQLSGGTNPPCPSDTRFIATSSPSGSRLKVFTLLHLRHLISTTLSGISRTRASNRLHFSFLHLACVSPTVDASCIVSLSARISRRLRSGLHKCH